MPHVRSFGDFPPGKNATWDHARAVIYAAPFGKTVSYQTGTERGPAAILDASANIEWYDMELDAEPCRAGVHTLPFPPKTAMATSIAMVSWVESTAKKILDAEKFPLLLGGEHSVSIGAIRACAKRHPGLTVLSLDAHSDLRSRFNGSSLNHACVMRRILSHAQPVLVGIRSTFTEAKRTIEQHQLAVFSAETALFDPTFHERLLEALGPTVYLSIDLDVFDPALMPATGTPEPGGLGWYNVLHLLRLVFQHRAVVGADVVELRPLAGNAAPDFLAAKLVYKLIGYKYYFPFSEMGPARG